jgi:hypothetical protein
MVPDSGTDRSAARVHRQSQEGVVECLQYLVCTTAFMQREANDAMLPAALGRNGSHG